MRELGSAAVNSATAKCAVTENGDYYVSYCYRSGSRRFRPISVWLSATLGVAESHKIKTKSTCSRQLTMISCSLLLLISIALVSPGNEVCKRYAKRQTPILPGCDIHTFASPKSTRLLT